MRESSPWFSAHTHSQFSVIDATANVSALVEKAAKMGQPAIALTDHGNLSGAVQLYKAGNKFGMQVFPGMEGYLTTEPITGVKGEKLDRFHVGLLALNYEGYKNLCTLSSLSHTRPRFNRFPRFDLNDLAHLSTIDRANEGIALTTGCFFGLVQQTLVNQGERAAQRVIEMYAKWFPNTFVEIQHHNIDHSEQATVEKPWTSSLTTDDDIVECLYRLAMKIGLPVIATQDSHYLDSKENVAHNLMKKMVYKGGVENEFPGDSFHLASAEWVGEHYGDKIWGEAEEGAEELLNLHDLELPALDKYKTQTPSTKKNPQQWLEQETYKALYSFDAKGLLSRSLFTYTKQLKHELEIIKYLGRAGYFTIWAEFMEFCEDEAICVEARGSANGSLVCWLLGITQVDPILWGTLFERFLSKDRTGPPDIDMDIENVRRPEAVAWLEKRFQIQQIGTFSKLGEREEDDKGSILVTYNSYLRAKLGNDKFVPRYGRGLESIGEVKRISTADYRGLRLLAKSEVFKSYGVHPSGLLLSGDTQKIKDYIPTMLVASSNTNVTQFEQDDAEMFGYLKLDILGQRTLTIMRRCQEMIGIPNPREFTWIPLNDRDTCKILSKSQPDSGIFQFEGWSTAKGARLLKIKNTNDCILAGALFRPACMASGVTDLYLERRFDTEARANVTHPHPAFAEVLKPTYGLVIFQEQVLEIMRKLGMSIEGINAFFKIVKDSGKGATGRNVLRAKEVHKTWGDLCKKNGIKDIEGAWHYIEGYTQYGFNKAHATGYGIRSYRIAYLKAHHPLEFMAALLECNAGNTKEKAYITEARRIDIRILPPDVNISGKDWTIDRKKEAIRKGLSSIKGIGPAAAEDIANNRPYDTIEEMIEKCGSRTVTGAPAFLKSGTWSGNLSKLREAGALGSLGIGRSGYE